MRTYEFFILLKPDLSDEQIKANIDRLQDVIDTNGRVYAIDFWGKKKLAYEVKKFTKGYYVRLVMTADPAHIEELERITRITQDVMKFLVVKLADQVDAEALEEKYGTERPAFEIRKPEEASDHSSDDQDSIDEDDEMADEESDDQSEDEADDSEEDLPDDEDDEFEPEAEEEDDATEKKEENEED